MKKQMELQQNLLSQASLVFLGGGEKKTKQTSSLKYVDKVYSWGS